MHALPISYFQHLEHSCSFREITCCNNMLTTCLYEGVTIITHMSVTLWCEKGLTFYLWLCLQGCRWQQPSCHLPSLQRWCGKIFYWVSVSRQTSRACRLKGPQLPFPAVHRWPVGLPAEVWQASAAQQAQQTQQSIQGTHAHHEPGGPHYQALDEAAVHH